MSSILLPTPSWSNNNIGNEKTDASTTLVSSPAEITLSENINNFQFDPVEATLPHNLSNTVTQVFGYITPGDTITITSQLANITLTASIAPSSGEFYTEAVAIATPVYLAKVAESIADTINQSLSFSSNYDIILSGTQMIITAKQYGDLYDLTTVSSSVNIFVLDSGGTSKFESQNVIDYSAFADLYVGNEVYADLVDKYQATLVDSYIIDSSRDTANLVASVVGNYVNPILPNKALSISDDYYSMDSGVTGGGIIIPNEDDLGNIKLLLRPYFFVYGDSYKYVTNGQKKRFVKGVSPVRWVQLGAFDKLLPYDMTDYTFIPNANKTFKWLTSCPNKKVITYDSHEFLQTIIKKTSNNFNFNLEVKYKFYDGTSSIVTKTAHSYMDLAGNTSFDVSPLAVDVLGIQVLNTKLVQSYEVKLKWTTDGINNVYSETKTYFMDKNCYDDNKEVIFLNEFGAWDALEFRGEIMEEMTRETLTIQRALPFNANTNESINSEVSINVNTDVNSLYTLRSGLINESHMEWVKKLGESSSVYIWDETFNSYRSIIIQDFSFIKDTKNSGDNISITFSFGTTNNSISR